jgi:hypothetical protein
VLDCWSMYSVETGYYLDQVKQIDGSSKPLRDKERHLWHIKGVIIMAQLYGFTHEQANEVRRVVSGVMNKYGFDA